MVRSVADVDWVTQLFRVKGKRCGMATRMMFLVIAFAAAVLTYYAGRIQGVESAWRQVSAAIAVGIMLAFCLLFFIGGAKSGAKYMRGKMD
jgi:low affinity Fe/Cu permease